MGILSGILSGGLGQPAAVPPGRWVRTSLTNARRKYLPSVWAMYVRSYAEYGKMNVNDPESLMEYDDWMLHFPPGWVIPDAFLLGKRTQWGTKIAASGSDGRRDPVTGAQVSKRAVISKKIDLIKHKGSSPRDSFWGEMSKKALQFADQANAPYVCSINASVLLPGKKLTLKEDGVTYERVITGVGLEPKQIRGWPFGVEATRDITACKVAMGRQGLSGVRRSSRGLSEVEDWMDADASLADREG